jgi:hypothetical protein
MMRRFIICTSDQILGLSNREIRWAGCVACMAQKQCTQIRDRES